MYASKVTNHQYFFRNIHPLSGGLCLLAGQDSSTRKRLARTALQIRPPIHPLTCASTLNEAAVKPGVYWPERMEVKRFLVDRGCIIKPVRMVWRDSASEEACGCLVSSVWSAAMTNWTVGSSQKNTVAPSFVTLERSSEIVPVAPACSGKCSMRRNGKGNPPVR